MILNKKLILLLSFALAAPLSGHANGSCASVFGAVAAFGSAQPAPTTPYQRELSKYEAYRVIGLKPTKDIRQFQAQQGITVTQRDASGNAIAGKIRVLSDNPWNDIQIIGDFNNWGTRLRPEDKLHPVAGTPYYEGDVKGLQHGMQYRLLVNGKQLLDPASDAYSSRQGEPYLNSIFWDFEKPGHYQSQNPVVDLRGKPIVMGETEIYALVKKWRSGNQEGPGQLSDTYRFIAESGVIGKLKEMGYNAIEFLPFNNSMDGADWRGRYQVFGLFAPDGKFGTPEEFTRMIDAFNREGIAVVMDAVVGHYPFHGNGGSREISPIGLHQWKKSDGRNLYGDSMSPWDTYRYDYANPYIRRFLVDSMMTMIKRYGISGIRFDNYDGIRFSPGGTEFLREFAEELRAYRPEATTFAEMFFGENRVMAGLDQPGGMGVNFRTNSNQFDWFKDNLQKRTEDLDMASLRSALRDPWGWQEAMRLSYLTNHDEAANRRDGATGSYVATLLNGGGWNYVEGKTKAYASLAATAGASYMDMPQLRLLQEGSFNGNSEVDWSLLRYNSQANVSRFFSRLASYVRDNPAFAAQNLHPNIENSVDYDNKVISLLRTDFTTGKRIFILINLGHKRIENYKFGMEGSGQYRVALDSDRGEFSGTNEFASRVPSGALQVDTNTWVQGKRDSINVPVLAPYQVLVLEQ